MDTPTRHEHTNRLIHETSPYLLQHAHNPVDWYPWNDEALQQARAQDKPILVSIGYSACHWCHVMEHESFEDEEVARVMNELFVCIKVDREERPDLDKIYQTAHQMLMQRAGGWPLNMFLTADDQTPFFGGTYFPNTPRHGMPAFTEVLKRVANYYHAHRADLDQQCNAVRDAFARLEPAAAQANESIQAQAIDAARRELEEQFDPVDGGFGAAPKFPHPTNLERLLRDWARGHLAGKPDPKALDMARTTLRAMAHGGIYDQLGGGFCRYSVDERWLIPHFEKMLYDNGPLLALYTDVAVATSEPLFKQIAIETGEWVMREMQSPAGGYYSTLDADSEGHEGKFYVWTPDEVHAVLTDAEFAVFALRYGLDGPANFEDKAWNLHIASGIEDIARERGLLIEQVQALLITARKRMFDAREQRVHPGRDEKILTAWNGLMIKGMARAGRFFYRPEFVSSAYGALDFIKSELWKDGRLLATHKDGRSHLNAYLDDYVFLIDGILELLQADWRDGVIGFAMELADVVLDHFEDKQRGGFYFTSDDHERLAFRPKPTSDEATPSGNGIAAQVLLRLGHVLGHTAYLDAAERTLTALYPTVARYPSAHNALVTAIEEYLQPPQTVVLRGDTAHLSPWIIRAQQYYAPRRLLFAIPSGATDLPGTLSQRAPKADVVAYVCQGHACAAPTQHLRELEEALKATEVAG